MVIRLIVLILLFASSADAGMIMRGSGTQSDIVYDTFIGTDNTDLSTRTGEVGATWTLHSSYSGKVLKITDAARLRATTLTPAVYYASGIPNSANYTVEADLYVVTSPTTYYGVAGRIDTASDTMYLARYLQSTGWILTKVVSGTTTTIGTPYAQTLTTGQTYKIKLSLNGSSIKLYVNDVERVAATDSTITNVGRVGIKMSGTTDTNTVGVHLDNFRAVSQ